MILINICSHQFDCYSRQSNHHQRKAYAINDELHESMRIETLIIVIFIILIKLFSCLLIIMYSLAVELSFGQKFKSDPRVDVRPDWTDQSSQFDSKIDVRRVLSSLFETSYI
jgi:hypothetical protein